MTLRRVAATLFTLGVVAAAQVVGTTPITARAALEPIAARQLIVRIDPAVTTIDAIDAAAGTTLVAASLSGNSSFLLALPPAGTAEAAMATIAAQPGVDYVVPNTTLTPPEVDQARIYAWRIYAWGTGSAEPTESTYAATAVELDAAQRISQGSGVVVAVLDTGVQLDHPALAGSLVAGWDFVDNDAVPAETMNGIDDDGDGLVDEGAGHGTHVAGIVHRVAPLASIMPVRVLDDDGTGTMWTAAEGMYWASMHGARVVNTSFGTHGSARPLRDAVAWLAANGTLVVGAAGNDGKDRTMFPAAAPDALAVASVGAGDIASTFTNFGRWVDIAAPGENIHSTYAFPADSYAMNSGTSMATPWVSGAAALLFAQRPAASPARVSSLIRAGATNIDALNPTVAGGLGAGRLDIVASLRAA